MDGARIYAENAIRKRTEQMNYLRLSSRLDAIVARLDTQAKMTTINKSMGNIVKSLESTLATGGNNFWEFIRGQDMSMELVEVAKEAHLSRVKENICFNF